MRSPHFPVRDADARDADDHEPEPTPETEAAVRRVSAPPARKGERREEAADQPADVSADRDSRNREREREVDHDQRQRVAAETAGGLPLEDEHRAEDAEDCTGGADGDSGGVRDERARGAGETRHEVETDEAQPAEVVLDGRAEPPQREHVERDVDDVRVQERGRDQPPPVSRGDQRPEERPLVEERAARIVQAVALDRRDEVDGDVERDQHPRDERVRCAARRARDDLRRPDAPRGSGVFGAAQADRGGRHALGADRATALRARETGLAVRMAVARRHPD
jgi:hypothetical protein